MAGQNTEHSKGELRARQRGSDPDSTAPADRSEASERSPPVLFDFPTPWTLTAAQPAAKDPRPTAPPTATAPRQIQNTRGGVKSASTHRVLGCPVRSISAVRWRANSPDLSRWGHDDRTARVNSRPPRLPDVSSVAISALRWHGLKLKHPKEPWWSMACRRTRSRLQSPP
jgi:hypothetical protein